MTALDPVTVSVLVLIAVIAAWNFVQLRSLNRRLTSLEKQHLSLVEKLEELIYRD
jgi:hypothetical protein